MAIRLEILRSGSSGNCTLLTAGKTRLLIDAGVGPRVLAAELAARGLAFKDLAGVVFTHCHHDHLRGNTAAALAKAGVPLYMNAGTWHAARARQTNAALAGIPGGGLRVFAADLPFTVGGLDALAFQVSHGDPGPMNPAGDPVGFVLCDDHDAFGYCTDLGHWDARIADALRPAGLVVLESNHDVEMARFSGRPWATKQWIMGDSGHLSNAQAAAAVRELFRDREGAGVILAHLSAECNTAGLARSTAREALAGLAEVEVGVAARLHATPAWELTRGVARAVEPALFA